MPSPDAILRCLNDAVTPVRDRSGRLLGCIPRISDDVAIVGPFATAWAAQACVVVDLDAEEASQLTALPGFVALDDAQIDLAIPVGGADADVGEEV